MILFKTDKKWQNRRKIIVPAFHFKSLEQFVDVFDRIGDTLVDTISKDFKYGDDIDFYPIFVLYSLDVMCGNCSALFSQSA